MSTLPAADQDQLDAESTVSAEAMKDQLRNDVTNWKAARSEESGRRADIAVPVSKPAAAKPTARTRQPKQIQVETKSAEVKKKPFGMSYDGMSNADYITYMISRGAR